MPKVQKTQLTQKGLEDLKQELEELTQKKRPKLVKRLANARDQGDLSENSDYLAARDELAFMDDRIEELEELLNSAQVVDGDSNGSGIGVGNTVTVQVKGRELTYNIVGEWEADPTASKISISSPIGKALEGKVEGDQVKVKAPAGEIEYKVIKVA